MAPWLPALLGRLAVAASPLDPLLVQAESDRPAAVAALRADGSAAAVAWADWLADPPDPTSPEAAARLRAVGDAASSVTVPCWLLRERPDAEQAFGAWYGSSMDAHPPLCRPALVDAPAWDALRSALVDLAQAVEADTWCGTMSTAVARDHHVSHLVQHLRGQPRVERAERARAEAALAWARGLDLPSLEAPAAAVESALAAARDAGPGWWVDAAVADRLEAARECVGDRGEHRTER